MKGCRPLTHEEVERAIGGFHGRYAVRNRCLFVLGVLAGFRISEMLSLRVCDVVANSLVRLSVTVRRRNMKGKRSGRTVYLAREAREAIFDQVQDLGYPAPGTPLFRSQAMAGRRAISRAQAYRVIVQAFESVGISENVATHSMRKTFADRTYQYMLDLVAAGEPVDAFTETSLALGHADPASTRAYLSFRDERRRAAIQAMGRGLYDH